MKIKRWFDKFGYWKEISISSYFIHFTWRENLPSIIKNNGLNYKKARKFQYGTGANYGYSIDVQHYLGTLPSSVKQPDEFVGILFTTSSIPDMVYEEEVVWNDKVVFDDYLILSVDEAIKYLGGWGKVTKDKEVI